MEAQELLRAHVIKISPDATVPEMVDLLDLYQARVLPVVDEDDNLLGAVYEEQVMQAALGGPASRLREPGERARARETAKDVRASDIMLASPPAVDEHEGALDALAKMEASGHVRLPVTSGRKVIGTIGRVDIAQALLEGEL